MYLLKLQFFYQNLLLHILNKKSRLKNFSPTHQCLFPNYNLKIWGMRRNQIELTCNFISFEEVKNCRLPHS